MSKQRITIGIIAIIGIISCLLPWFNLNFGMNIPFLSKNRIFGNGLNATMLQQGWIILLGYLGTIAIVFFTKPLGEKTDRQKTKWLLITGSVTLTLTLYSMIQISNVYFMMKVSFGIGLYISLASSAGILGLAYMHWKKTFSESNSAQPREEN